MAEKIVRATVTGRLPVYINGVLHLPGEDAYANLDELGVDSLDDPHMVGLEAKSAKAEEHVVKAPIAAVAPHAPDAPNPQGLAPGTRQSGTGRLIAPGYGEDSSAVEAVGAEAPVTQEERKEAAADTAQQGKTQKPSK